MQGVCRQAAAMCAARAAARAGRDACMAKLSPVTCQKKFFVVSIPKRTVKIVVTNRKDAWPTDPFGQLIGRRISQLEIKNRLY